MFVDILLLAVDNLAILLSIIHLSNKMWCDPFKSIIRRDEPLAMHTWFQTGGMAEFYAQPETQTQAAELVDAATEANIPIRLLGEGSNVLIRNDGVSGLVINLDSPAFQKIAVEGNCIKAGAAARLGRVVTTAVHAGLAGLEDFIGVPGSVGGALHVHVAANMTKVSRCLKSTIEMDFQGKTFDKTADELAAAYQDKSLNSLIILEATFELELDDPKELAQQMQKRWILKKSQQPMSFQCCGRIFKNSAGASAGELIDRAGLKGARIGGAVISERHANYIIAEPECSSEDILRLIELVRDQVHKRTDVLMDLDLEIW